MSELKPCPFCGSNGRYKKNMLGRISYNCENGLCPISNVDMCLEEWNTRPIEDALRAEIARRDEIIARLKEDGERLASGYEQVNREAVPYCVVCKKDAFSGYLGQIKHDDWCPITLHRALMKELE